MKQTLLFLLLLSAWCWAQNWTNLEDFQESARDDGCSFVIDDKAYFGTGSIHKQFVRGKIVIGA